MLPFGVRRPAGFPVMPRLGARQAGFALVAVIWTLGLITLLGMAVIVGARYRTKASTNFASIIKAQVAAESAVNLALAFFRFQQNIKDPFHCWLPGGELAIITIYQESGKVDLNTATQSTLMHFFTALAGNQSVAAQITANVIAFRSPGEQSQSTPPEAHFTTIMQLDQVRGVSPQLFRAALRHVTVRSGRSEPDIEAASPAMLSLLNVEPKQATSKHGLPQGGSITVRADISTPDATRFIREALVSLDGGSDRPFIIREWRRGEIYSSDSRHERLPETGPHACLQVRGRAAH